MVFNEIPCATSLLVCVELLLASNNPVMQDQRPGSIEMWRVREEFGELGGSSWRV